jgi:hypothetical protein
MALVRSSPGIIAGNIFYTAAAPAKPCRGRFQGAWYVICKTTGRRKDATTNFKTEPTMKKLILFIAAALLASSRSYAQADLSSKDAKSKVIVGFKGGINRSNVFDEAGGDFVANAKPGFAGGVFMAVPFGGLLGFQPELLISQKGFQGSGTIKNENYLITRTTTHLDIPLQLQVKPFHFFSVVGGVMYSYLLNQKDRITFGNNYEEQKQEFDNVNIRRNTFGSVIGFDVNVAHFVFSGRSCWDMISNHGDGTSSTPRYKNMWLQGTIGYRIY